MPAVAPTDAGTLETTADRAPASLDSTASARPIPDSSGSAGPLVAAPAAARFTVFPPPRSRRANPNAAHINGSALGASPPLPAWSPKPNQPNKSDPTPLTVPTPGAAVGGTAVITGITSASTSATGDTASGTSCPVGSPVGNSGSSLAAPPVEAAAGNAERPPTTEADPPPPRASSPSLRTPDSLPRLPIPLLSVASESESLVTAPLEGPRESTPPRESPPP